MNVERKTMNGEQSVAHVRDSHKRILRELRKRFVGQDDAIDQIIISLLAGGHSLLLGVPGLGKTMLVRSIAEIFSLDFNRIQFTPDLMPADIYGTEILEENPEDGRRHLKFVKGPVFTNILLADEINRTPPKTQAALLEAMEEHNVTVAGQTYPLDRPFFVLATQNPIELEGTYPLPEAQLDRFLLNIILDYLDTDDEVEMVAKTTAPESPDLDEIFEKRQVHDLQATVREVPVSRDIIRYAVRLVTATRPHSSEAPAIVSDKVKWGAGSRASQALILTGKARALLYGRYNVATEDIRALALPVLRHRVLTNFHADAEGVTSEDIIRQLLDTVSTE